MTPEPLEMRQADPALLEGRDPERQAADVPDLAEVAVPAELRSEIEAAMGRYPDKRSASIPALWAVQNRHGWCSPEGIRQAAAVMGLTPAYLEGIASFYDLFHLEPHGRHSVLVCTNISCWLRGGDELLDAFRDAAGDEPADGSAETGISVRGFECLGACEMAPMASIDARYYGPLERAEAETAVGQLRDGAEVLPEKALARRRAAGGPDGPPDERLADHPLNRGPEGSRDG